jgi:bacterioferritin (cytochrome b1)
METIRVRFLAEFLNEMLAAERTAHAMYRFAIARCGTSRSCMTRSSRMAPALMLSR